MVIDDIKSKILSNPFSCTYSWVVDWINDHLKTLPQGSKFVELGTFVGGTTRLIALANPHLDIHTIDLSSPFINLEDNKGMISDIEEAYNLKNVKSDTLSDIKRMHLEDLPNVTVYTGNSTSIPVTNFHASFVDADHSYKGVLADLDFAWENTVEGGFIFGDDMNSPNIYNAVVHWTHMKSVEFTVFSKGFKIVKSAPKHVVVPQPQVFFGYME
jgi:hypothetical protein